MDSIHSAAGRLNEWLGRDISYTAKIRLWGAWLVANVFAAFALTGGPAIIAAALSSLYPAFIFYADERRLKEKGVAGSFGYLLLLVLFLTVVLPVFWLGIQIIIGGW